jgi:acyl carrier protein
MPASPTTALDRATTTSIVQTAWAELLGLAAVGPDDDFFEIGGHSLMAAAAVARVGQRLGLDLPPLAIFEAPTVAEMVELIAEVRDGRRADRGGFTPFLPPWVVPLQREGGGRPVFVFPAGHDEISALAVEAELAVRVGRDRPFWGFGRDDPRLDQAREQGIRGLAAEYAAQMRALQGEGPFLLAASCAGGAYAWETAAQLVAGGAEIAGMFFHEVPLDPRQTVSLPARMTDESSTPAATAVEYRPQPLPVTLTLIVTEFWHERRWSEPWRSVALGGTSAIVLSEDAIADPASRQDRIARHMREWIETAEARLADG